MFPKNLTTLRITNPDVFKDAEAFETKLSGFAHTPIGSTATISTGWTPVRDELFQFRYMNLIRLDFLIEKKSVPASAVARVLKARIKEIVDQGGTAPGRKATKELKQEVKEALLMRATPSDATTKVWIDLDASTLSIESTSDSVIDLVVSTLGATAEIQMAHLAWPTSDVLTAWVSGQDEEGEEFDIPAELTADDFMTLEHPGENGKAVRYERANLSDDDVMANFDLGATVNQLALTYDSQISFVLNGNSGQLAKIKVGDVLKAGTQKEKDADAYQNNVYLVGATLRKLNNFLIGQA